MALSSTAPYGRWTNRRTKRLARWPLVAGVATATIALLTSAGSCATHVAPALAASTSGVVVTTTGIGTLQTQLSTNNVWSGMLDSAPAGQSSLNSLHAPLVRLHIGDDGYPISLPEVNPGSWDFSALDLLVNDVFASGQQPLMNIKFAPDWMWTCYPNSVGVTGQQNAGQVSDSTFQTFARYMAQLASYYNNGSMTTEAGAVINNPAGTQHSIKYWEIWNEPDLSNETPCSSPAGQALTPAQYVTMWNAVTASMLQIDPSLHFVGPATAGPQFGSSIASGNEYVDALMHGSTVKPTALSFHAYGYWDNSVSDAWLFDGDGSDPANNCCGGIPDLKNGVTGIHSQYPSVPVWLTEVNVNAAWDNDTHKRPWDELAAAWWGAAFQALAPLGAGIIYQYDLVDAPQFGLIDTDTGAPYISYYVVALLDQEFPRGSTLLGVTSTMTNVVAAAVQKPDNTISILIVNRQLSAGASTCGTGGIPATVPVTLPGLTLASVAVQRLDSGNVDCSTNRAVAPTTEMLDPAKPISVSFAGYGLAVINVSLAGTNPVASPTSTATQASASGTATVAPTVAPSRTATSVPPTPQAATPTSEPMQLTSTPTATSAIGIRHHFHTPIPASPIAATATLALPSSATPNALFNDTFDTEQSLADAWTEQSVSPGNGLSLDKQLSHSGTTSLEAITVPNSDGNAYVTEKLNTGAASLDIRAFYYLSKPVNWGEVQVLSLYSGSTFVGWLTYNVDPSAPSLQFYNGANDQWYTCGRGPTLNAWHSVELHYGLATSNSAAFMLRLDGTPVCQASGIETSSGSSHLIDRVVVGIDAADPTVGLTIHVDDLTIATKDTRP